MGNILSGLVLVNGTDIWTEYGVFLVEDRRGGKITNIHSNNSWISINGTNNHCTIFIKITNNIFCHLSTAILYNFNLFHIVCLLFLYLYHRVLSNMRVNYFLKKTGTCNLKNIERS